MVVSPAEVVWDTGATPEGVDVDAVWVSVTGQMVVDIGIVDVTTVVESAGQSVKLGAQLVIVTTVEV